MGEPVFGSVDSYGTPVLVFGESPAPSPTPRAGLSPAELGYVGPPTPEDLRSYLSWPALDEEQQASAQAHVTRAVRLCKAYTRGRGWIASSMAPELTEVVLSVAARTWNNPTSDSRTTAGQYSSSPGQPDFTLVERLTLDLWRRRCA